MSDETLNRSKDLQTPEQSPTANNWHDLTDLSAACNGITSSVGEHWLMILTRSAAKCLDCPKRPEAITTSEQQALDNYNQRSIQQYAFTDRKAYEGEPFTNWSWDSLRTIWIEPVK